MVIIFAVVIALALKPLGPMPSSLRQSVAGIDNASASGVSSVAEPGLAPGRTGGIKKRLAQEKPQTEPQQHARGGVRQRLEERSSPADVERNGGAQPFNSELRKMWAKGELKSSMVQRLATTASEQQCVGQNFS